MGWLPGPMLCLLETPTCWQLTILLRARLSLHMYFRGKNGLSLIIMNDNFKSTSFSVRVPRVSAGMVFAAETPLLWLSISCIQLFIKFCLFNNIYISVIDQLPYRENQQRPSQEEIVKLSNKTNINNMPLN